MAMRVGVGVADEQLDAANLQSELPSSSAPTPHHEFAFSADGGYSVLTLHHASATATATCFYTFTLISSIAPPFEASHRTLSP